MPQNLQDLIQFLQSNNVNAEYPTCNGKVYLSKLHSGIVGVEPCCWNTTNGKGNFVNKIFQQQKLNSNEPRKIFHPVDFVVFNGIKNIYNEI
jgi:hypothetical protein